jgi:hypothetical protein
MSTLQGFAGLAQMADQAQQAPVNLATSKANLEAIQQGIEQRKLTDPVQLATSQQNLAILNQSYKQNETVNPLIAQQHQNAVTQGGLTIEEARRRAELEQTNAKAINSAIREVQQDPNSKTSSNALIELGARNPSALAGIQAAKNQYTAEQQKFVTDANFNAFIAMRNESPDEAAAALIKARDAAQTSGQPKLVDAFNQDLALLQKNPEAAYDKFTLLSLISPAHKQAIDDLGKMTTLPTTVQTAVNKFVAAGDAARKQANTASDLLNRWQSETNDKYGLIDKLASKARIETGHENPSDILRKETDAALNLDRLKIFKEEVGSMGIRNLKEFETALAGKVDVYGKKEQVMSSLEKIAKFSQLEQAYQQANASFTAKFRGSPDATRDVVLNGIEVKKGMNIEGYKKQVAGRMFPSTIIMPDGTIGQVPGDQVDAFLKTYPGAKVR